MKQSATARAIAKGLAVLVCSLLAGGAFAQSAVTVTIGAQAPTAGPIPTDFVGLSFGMRAMLPNAEGAHFFSPTNTALVTLFQNLGIKHLRMGGTTVESPPTTPIPNTADIDSFFAFVRAAGVEKVIYSLRLLETNSALNYAQTNADIAKYIWKNYRQYLDCFAIGNETDLQRVFNQDVSIRDFDSFIHKWRAFAAAITNAVPDAKFAGPDASSGNVPWTMQFAEAERGSGLLKAVTEHFYVGGRGRDVTPERGITKILSTNWTNSNENMYRKVASPVMTMGLAFRFTEANDHYSGGVRDASNTFAGALWALDFLHWWAAQGAVGVDFHNTQWVVNDVITPDENNHITTNPKGYGFAAFNLSGRGRPEPLTLSNSDNVNLTAYAVRDGQQLVVTLINKEHGTGARAARVTLAGAGKCLKADALTLNAPNGDVTAKTGITLGGSSITNNTSWRGRWNALKPDEAGKLILEVPATSAAVLKLQY